jgi:hypothetical protein
MPIPIDDDEKHKLLCRTAKEWASSVADKDKPEVCPSKDADCSD